MKPHPRIRKTVKWGGAVVSVVLLVVWIVSGWGQVQFTFQDGDWIGIASGRFNVGYMNATPAEVRRGFRFYGPDTYRLRWWFYHGALSIAWQFSTPLWPLVGASLFATSFSWRLDTLARRRARLNLCPKCQYDRTGLAPAAVCPECATPAPPPHQESPERKLGDG